MRKKLTALGGGAALVLAAITIPATSAAAAELDIEIVFPDFWAQAESTLKWSLDASAEEICSDPIILVGYEGSTPAPQPAEIITVDADGRGGEVNLALAADNNLFEFDFRLECDDDTHTGEIGFAQINIEKQVIGVPYTNASYEVAVNFESAFEDTAVFPSGGGTVSYYQLNAGEWTFDETADGGADSVSISHDTLDAPEPGKYSVTVTNTFNSENVFPTVLDVDDFITTSGEREWEQSNTNYPPICEDGDVTTEGYVFSEATYRDVEPAFDVTVDGDGNSGSIDVANAPGTGYYTTTVVCEDDGYTFNYILNTAVDVFTLTKDVTGDAPTDANFVIEVTASYPDNSGDGFEHGTDTHTDSVSFPATGGTQTLYHHTSEQFAFWTAEEINNGGADSVNVEERNYANDDGDAFATITNVFEPEDEEEAAPTPVKEDPTYAG